MIFPSRRQHSFWVFHQRGRHIGWYVNLEAPHRSGETTITTSDGILDIWIPADTGEAVWKDEDEFGMALKVGRLSYDEATALRAEGERVIAERRWPTGWENWRPPDGWERPQLPSDWDTRA
jgi:predicted RNA-binding protein associated with RNAse of E/G family